ncbi:MAG: hypothetical protein KY468_07425 [Armatimonadetes bacterium]|nr:hypothetical protein [Armatimonadota bacterium]
MISFKRYNGREEKEERSEALPPQKPARDVWNVVLDSMTVGEESVFALSFHRKGTSVYYLHRHYRSREEADRETMQLTHDLALDQSEFEGKYALDIAS